MKRILVDMDEVIADVTLAMTAWYKKMFGGDIDYAKMLEGESLVKGFPEERQQLVRQQLYEPGFFRHLPVMDDSVEVLKEINKKYDLYIVSAATEFPNSLTEKYYWLEDHFPFIGWKQMVFCGDKKMIKADYLLDDHAKHLQYFTGKPFIFTAPHNLNEHRFERLNNWKEVGDKFL
ncbi:MAG: 5'(3')-deoxyribonucleotidase [Chitinophagaceae bacterium]